jgi:hypothetical protein
MLSDRFSSLLKRGGGATFSSLRLIWPSKSFIYIICN